MSELLDGLSELKSIEIPAEAWLIGTLVLGVVLLFWGKKIIRLWLGLAGLAGGTVAGLRLVEEIPVSETVGWIVVALLALAGAFLLSLAYKACFFVGGIIGGIFLGNYLLGIFWPGYPDLLIIVIAVAVGLIAVLLEPQFTIIATAITGAMLTADTVVSLVYKTSPGDLIRRVQIMNVSLTDDLIILLAIGLLATVGIYVQRRKVR